MSNRNSFLMIGELARRTGLASSALRYYERVGLLSPTARAGGKRHYDPASVERVALIQLCQDAGFTLREIRSFIGAVSRRGRTWSRLFEAKVQELETRIVQAERAKALVQHALACSHRSLDVCPNFRAALETHLVAPPKAVTAAKPVRHRPRRASSAATASSSLPLRVRARKNTR